MRSNCFWTATTSVGLQPSVWWWAWGCWWSAGLAVGKNKLDAEWRLRTHGLPGNCVPYLTVIIWEYWLPLHSCFLFFFFLNFFYLLIIFGCVGSSSLCAGSLQLRRAGSTPRCGAWASHCSGSPRAERGLQARGLSRSVARGIFLDQGSNPRPAWQEDS